MNFYCKLAASLGLIGMFSSWLAVALAARAKREYWRARRELEGKRGYN